MAVPAREEQVFFTCACTREQAAAAELMIGSLRAFGGELATSPFIVALDSSCRDLVSAFGDGRVQSIEILVPESVSGYYFSRKVCAAATAEKLVQGSCRTLVWLIPELLICRPPSLFALLGDEAAAVRPVHIRNVGLQAGRDPDVFWKGVYAQVGEPDPSFTVQSFIEGERIRPYFNSAAYSVDPSLGLLGRWQGLFEALVRDEAYQREACQDEWHRIFLHQAVLSTLLAVSAGQDRIRALPPDYGYPYNLQGRVPEGRRATSLGDLTCAIYEERPVDPRAMDDIRVGEPLRTWLIDRLQRGGGTGC